MNPKIALLIVTTAFSAASFAQGANEKYTACSYDSRTGVYIGVKLNTLTMKSEPYVASEENCPKSAKDKKFSYAVKSGGNCAVINKISSDTSITVDTKCTPAIESLSKLN